MGEPVDPQFRDVYETTEQAPRDRHFHGKQPTPVDDDDLARRTEQERVEFGVDDYDPDQVPPAAE
jgi:hypothetical protein